MQITREQRFTTTLAERATCNLYNCLISFQEFFGTAEQTLPAQVWPWFWVSPVEHWVWETDIGSVQWLRHVWLFATHGLQRARLPCLSPTPGACSNSCPLSQWPIQLSHPLSAFQSWKFIGRTDAEAETPTHCHLIRRTDSLEKTVMLEKIEGRRRRGWKRKLE